MPPPPPPPLGRFARGLALSVALLLGTLLATAATLRPSEAGFGTHMQLGLSDCFVVRQWGVRCPSCGMTTSWAHLMRGNLSRSVEANTGGFLLGLLSLLAVPWLLASGLLGRWCYLRPTANLLFPLVSALVLVLLFDWMRHTGWSLWVERFFK